MVASGLILLHLRGFLRKPVEAPDIYFLEAVGDETAVRGRGAKALRDVRSLGEVVPLFGRIVTLSRIEEVEEAVRGILSELREQYVLGYYPSIARNDGSWHRVSVRVGRHDLTVRARGS